MGLGFSRLEELITRVQGSGINPTRTISTLVLCTRLLSTFGALPSGSWIPSQMQQYVSFPHGFVAVARMPNSKPPFVVQNTPESNGNCMYDQGWHYMWLHVRLHVRQHPMAYGSFPKSGPNMDPKLVVLLWSGHPNKRTPNLQKVPYLSFV